MVIRTEDKLRMLAQGAEEYIPVHGAWRKQRQQPATELDCICSKELAAYLIHLLRTGEEAAPASIPRALNAMPHQQLSAPAHC